MNKSEFKWGTDVKELHKRIEELEDRLHQEAPNAYALNRFLSNNLALALVDKDSRLHRREY